MEFAREGVSVAISSHSDLIDKTAEEIRKETGVRSWQFTAT